MLDLTREAQLNEWVKKQLNVLQYSVAADFILKPVSDDASFRRYYRAETDTGSLIVVDAPPKHENSKAFVAVANRMALAGLQVPEVFATDFDQGFMLLADFGNRLYLDELKAQLDVGSPIITDGAVKVVQLEDAETNDIAANNVAYLYQQAMAALVKMWTVDVAGLPVYSAQLLQAEMSLFENWFLDRYLKITLTTEVSANLSALYVGLVSSAEAQPQVFVHRDYHARNLMVIDDLQPGVGIIDFQDAVFGPMTYDLVSLLKDCYWRFSREQVITWVRAFWQQLNQSVNFEQFLKWFDLMGLQRHLKCAGIFSRLYLRDGKQGYLGDIPRVIEYMLEVAQLYPELVEFGLWLKADVEPALIKMLSKN
ncbi:MAG: phosphotransferase [Pseudomonadales bacterium]|nr:phosphotransferase [Pseudomonadales bacterium]